MANTPAKPATPEPTKPAEAPDTGKGEKRLFQVGPGEKKLMTKAEAVKAGKFWAD